MVWVVIRRRGVSSERRRSSCSSYSLGSPLAWVMACCLMAPRHCQKYCHIIKGVCAVTWEQFHKKGSLTFSVTCVPRLHFKITTLSHWRQQVKSCSFVLIRQSDLIFSLLPPQFHVEISYYKNKQANKCFKPILSLFLLKMITNCKCCWQKVPFSFLKKKLLDFSLTYSKILVKVSDRLKVICALLLLW